MQSTTLKRLNKDLKEILENPLPGANAIPSANDLYYWHGNIEVPLTINNQKKSAPMHFKIEFNDEYPKKAPNVGFCTHFPFHMGASYTMTDGKLNGLLGICLNILGNLDKVHTEWKTQVGEGWSPSMSITTLLVNLQSVFLDLDSNLNTQEKNKLYNDLQAFKCQVNDKQHTCSSPYPEIYTNEQILAKKSSQNQQQQLQNINQNDILLSKFTKPQHQLIETFSKQVNFTQEQVHSLYVLLDQLSNPELAIQAQQQMEEEKKCEQEKKVAEKLKSNIFCYISGASIEDGEILGFGIYLDKKLLSSFSEFLSFSEFKKGNRQSSNKSEFSHFMPAFICPEHGEHKDWLNILKDCIKSIGNDLLQISSQTLNEQTLVILPKLINSMVVEMKNDSKAQAISFFEGLCSFWRTLFFLYQKNPKLKDTAVKIITDFCSGEDKRHKDYVPDIGIVLAIYTTVSDCIPIEKFIDAYLDENFIRCVMWWFKGRQSTSIDNVFEATKVSRELCIFQLTLLRNVIGQKPEDLAQLMDKTYGKMPDKLEQFQKILKAQKIQDWKSYFEETGCSQKYKENILKDVQGWIDETVQRNDLKGPKYQKSGGGGRGGQGGRGGYDGGYGGRGGYDGGYGGRGGYDGGYGGRGGRGGYGGGKKQYY